MKRCFLILILLLLSVYSSEAFEHPSPHPRILMREADEKALKALIAENALLLHVHNTILEESEAMFTEPAPDYQLTGRRLLPVARESRRKIFYLSYSWRMTRDDRFLRRAEEELLAIASFRDWNPSHFLDAAELTMASAIGLDWLHSGLTPASRDRIAEAIIEKGLLPSFKPQYSKWLAFTNNWNQVCNAGMVFGALAVKERIPDLAMNIIRRSIKSVFIAMQEYEPDGGYPEGYGYWAYGTTFNVMMISALEREAGTHVVPLNKGFLNTGYYLRHMAGPSGQNFNYSDNHPVVPLNPAMFWFAFKNDDTGLLFNELKLLQTSRHLHRVRELPALMVWAMALDLNAEPAPRELVWAGKGKNAVATLRSGWTDDSLFIGFKAGSPGYNHGHMDVGSFVFDALGERWAADLPPQDYHSLEKEGLDIWRYHKDADRWRVFRFSEQAHNILTINNKPLVADAEADIRVLSDKPGFLSCVSDLSAMYGQRVGTVKRGVAIVQSEEAFVQDEFYLASSCHVNWKMLTPAEVEITGARTAVLTQNGKQIELLFDVPDGVRIRSWNADPPAGFDVPNPGYRFIGFDIPLKAKQTYVFRVTFKTKGVPNNRAIVPIEQWPY